jgi:hypothetical protein
MSKQKAQGTAWESELVRRAKAAGLDSRRLAEGGSADEGDLEVIAGGIRVVVEGKARAALGAHAALAKAQTKAGEEPAVVAWKRLVRRDGSTRRITTGVRDLMLVPTDLFFALLAKAGGTTTEETPDA